MVFNKLRGKKKEKAATIPKKEFLKMKPTRNPDVKWEKTAKGITIIIPLAQPPKKGKKKKGFISMLSPPAPTQKKIDLDKVGAVVWELCDGENTVEDIAERMHQKYKLLTSEAEISLNTYFQQLSKRGLIGFIIPEETRARLGESRETEKKNRKTRKIGTDMRKLWKSIKTDTPYSTYGGPIEMKCPKCGKEVKTPIKEWDLSPKVHVKLYECCGKKFREYIKKKAK